MQRSTYILKGCLIVVPLVIQTLEEKGWIENLCSVARQFTDDYIRVVFLIILDMLCSCNVFSLCITFSLNTKSNSCE